MTYSCQLLIDIIIKSKGVRFMQLICQSCGMPIDDEQLKGIKKDSSKSDEYCSYCYQKGEFTSKATMEEMVAICLPPTINAGAYADEQSAKSSMFAFFHL